MTDQELKEIAKDILEIQEVIKSNDAKIEYIVEYLKNKIDGN